MYSISDMGQWRIDAIDWAALRLLNHTFTPACAMQLTNMVDGIRMISFNESPYNRTCFADRPIVHDACCKHE